MNDQHFPSPDSAKNRTILLAARWLLGGIFLAASLPKLADPAGFALQLFRYRLLPDALINPIALLLPWLELWTAGSLLCWPRARRMSAGLLLLMTGTFLVAGIYTLATGRHIPCGCFSTRPDADVLTVWSSARDILLAGLAAMVWWHAGAQRHAPTARSLSDLSASREL